MINGWSAFGGPTMAGTTSDWEGELRRWLKPFLDRHLGSDPNAAPNGTDTARALSRGLLPYCASAGASLGSGLGAGLAAGSVAGVSATGLSGVAAGAAAGVSAIGLRATVRFGAARFRLIALARPRVGFLAPADLPRRAAVVRRAAAALRFVADPRFPAFLVLVVFAFDFRAVLAMTSPLWWDDSLFCRSVWCFGNASRRVASDVHRFTSSRRNGPC